MYIEYEYVISLMFSKNEGIVYDYKCKVIEIKCDINLSFNK